MSDREEGAQRVGQETTQAPIDANGNATHWVRNQGDDEEDAGNVEDDLTTMTTTMMAMQLEHGDDGDDERSWMTAIVMASTLPRQPMMAKTIRKRPIIMM